MRTLIVGIGALGGLIGARLSATGIPVRLATRDSQSASNLKVSGLRVSGVGGDVTASADAAPLEAYSACERFDLIALATKAHDAISIAPQLLDLLSSNGMLLPIQNGGVSQILSDRLGCNRILGGISNLGATMVSPGVYEQRNAGHLLIGELNGGDSERVRQTGIWLGRAIEVRVTPNLRGAIWSKLLLNCAVTTLGAIAGMTMREYFASQYGRALFEKAYDEALAVALASGARPERMLVEPIPPNWAGQSVPGPAHDDWLSQVITSYGDLKPSMLQDFERGRITEIDYINGYVTNLGRRVGVCTPVNAAVVQIAHEIERGQVAPSILLLERVLQIATRNEKAKKEVDSRQEHDGTRTH